MLLIACSQVQHNINAFLQTANMQGVWTAINMLKKKKATCVICIYLVADSGTLPWPSWLE